MKKALLIIDVQNDYFPNGKCELYKSEEALSTIKKLLEDFRKRGLPVFYIQHVSSAQAAFFNPETNGVQIHEGIKPLNTETVIVKHFPNSFYETKLQDELRKHEITDLTVCGMMTHMCVDTTVRAAKDYGYKITLISDGCATKDLEWNGVKFSAGTVQSVYMASLAQSFATVTTSENFFTYTVG